MKRQCILILTGIFPPDIGGPATQLDALIRELIKRDFNVRVLTFGKKDKLVYPYYIKRVSGQLSPFLKRFIFLFHTLRLSVGSDVLYIQDLYIPGFCGLVAKKVLGKKLVVRFVGDSAWERSCVEGLVSDDLLTFQDKTYSSLIEKRKKTRARILLASDYVIVVSNFLKEVAVKIGVKPDKIKVIYNSIEFLDVKGNGIVKEELNCHGKVILTIARLVPWKGVDMLIELMPRLVERYKDLCLVVVGQGPEFNNLKKMTQELGLESHVIFTGKLNRQQIVNYFKISDIFVLNTNYEGMSHTILEAMALGAPIIATKAGGNPETIKDQRTGLLVRYRNKEEWFLAMCRLLDDEDFAARLAASAKKDLARFSWSNLVDQTERVFRQLL